MSTPSEAQWYLPPTEPFPPVMDMDTDAFLNFETDWGLLQPLWDTDVAPLDHDGVGQPSQGTEYVPLPLNGSSNLTLADHWTDTSFGPSNDESRRTVYSQPHTNSDPSNSSTTSLTAFGNALPFEPSLSTQGRQQPIAPSPYTDMSEQYSPALSSPSKGACICEICAKSFNKKCELKYVNAFNPLHHQPSVAFETKLTHHPFTAST
jgi:hypothetical protein